VLACIPLMPMPPSKLRATVSRSLPVENAPQSDPVKTITRTASSASKRSMASTISDFMSPSIALSTLGRLRVR
jgi:hypothetical protein